MPIQFRCNRCLEEIGVPDGTAGKKTRCPHCQQVQEIPAPQTSTAPAPPPTPGLPPEPDSPYESAVSEAEMDDESFAADPANPFASPSASAKANPFGGNMSESVRAAMRQKLLIPAITQTVIVGLGLISCLGFAAMGIILAFEPAERSSGLLMLGFYLAWSLLHVLSLVGLANAFRFHNIAWAWIGFIIPIVSFPLNNCCCLLFVFPIGASIWGMVCLSDPKVRSLFP